MTAGTVNAELEPLIRLTIRDTTGAAHAVEAVVDTGFNGFLTLPPALIAALGLPWLCRQDGQMADGSILPFDVHVATVDWHGESRKVEAEATDAQPLLGMALLEGSDLHIQVVPGGAISVARLP
jgi:clan AA aspartic protease